MKEKELEVLYGHMLKRTRGTRRDDCPSPERLQAVAEGDADADERLSVMEHVAGCLPCQRDLALVAQVAGTRPAPGRRIPVAWLAAAATVVLAFVGVRAIGRDEPVRPILRGDQPGVVTVSPAGEVTGGGADRLVWRPVPGATRFEVEILTQEGVLVYSGTVRDTVVSMPSDIGRSVPYRWHVTAIRADGTRTESAWVTFTIPPD